LRPYAYFIHSLPGQNRRSTSKTIEAMRSVFEIGAEKITVYRFRPLPGTAFEKFKVRVNADSRKISKYAIHLNRVRKELLVGNVVKAIAAPGAYAYPLQGGPVIRLKNGRPKIGEVIEVKITDVVSDRLVEGFICSNPSSS
jgi:hypothetical protein